MPVNSKIGGSNYALHLFLMLAIYLTLPLCGQVLRHRGDAVPDWHLAKASVTPNWRHYALRRR
jgi:hypothetical protein